MRAKLKLPWRYFRNVNWVMMNMWMWLWNMYLWWLQTICGDIKSITKHKRHVMIMNCRMEGWLPYDDKVKDNASVLSPSPTSAVTFRCISGIPNRSHLIIVIWTGWQLVSIAPRSILCHEYLDLVLSQFFIWFMLLRFWFWHRYSRFRYFDLTPTISDNPLSRFRFLISHFRYFRF